MVPAVWGITGSVSLAGGWSGIHSPSGKNRMRLKKLNTGIASKINRSTVLTLIHRYPLISRAQIAERIGLDRSTITHILNYLLKEGLVEEVDKGRASSRGGRCPMQLRVRYDSKNFIAIDVGTRKIEAVMVNLRGDEICRIQTGLVRGEPLMDKLVETLSSFQRRKKLFSNTVVIGISCPGVVDAEQGIVRLNVLHNWREVAVASQLQERFDKPVFVENDANCAAMGELEQYRNEGVGSLLYLFIREAPPESSYLLGVGGGTIFDGRLWRGAHGYSGEISHAVHARVAPIQERYGGCETQESSNHSHRAMLGQLLKAAREGDARIARMASDIADSLGNLLSELAALLDPESVMVFVYTPVDAEPFMLQIENAFVKWHNICGNAPVRFLLPRARREAMLQGVIALAQEKLFVRDASHSSLLFL